jgi:hypothetical protein
MSIFNIKKVFGKHHHGNKMSNNRSSIEYSGKWKMLNYHTKRFFQMFLVSSYELNNNLYIHLSNDNSFDLTNIETIIRIYSIETSDLKYEQKVVSRLNKHESKLVFTESISNLVRLSNCGVKSNCFVKLFAKYSQSDEESSIFINLNQRKNERFLIFYKNR